MLQGKRHALGIAEMVYYLSMLPKAVAAIEGGCGDVAYFFARGVPIAYKMFAIHIVMSTYWLFSAANGPLVWWVWHHQEENTVGDWRWFWIYLNLYSAIFSTCMFMGMNVLNITL